MEHYRLRWPRFPRWLRLTVGLLLFAAALLGIKAWRDTMSDPVVLETAVTLADYPVDVAPITIALLADIHVAGPDMPPSRLARIVAQVNGMEPDLVLIAGDFVSDKRTATQLYSAAEAIAPLAGLSAPLGVIAVAGNHDHWRDMAAISRELDKVGITLLVNEAVRVGPLVIGGLDDDFTGRADIAATVAAMSPLDGARLILTHSPDVFPAIPQEIGLVLAGHTHCGQIGWPWGGSPATMSRYGQRYACGRVDENAQTIITGGGLGTSVLPLRLFTQPDVWLVTVGPR